MTGDSSDDDSSDDGSFAGIQKTNPPSRPHKKKKSIPSRSPKTDKHWVRRVQAIKLEKPSWVDDAEDVLGSAEDYVREVHTEELPNTQDFGGAKALVALQSEPQEFEDGSSTDEGN